MSFNQKLQKQLKSLKFIARGTSKKHLKFTILSTQLFAYLQSQNFLKRINLEGTESPAQKTKEGRMSAQKVFFKRRGDLFFYREKR